MKEQPALVFNLPFTFNVSTVLNDEIKASIEAQSPEENSELKELIKQSLKDGLEKLTTDEKYFDSVVDFQYNQTYEQMKNFLALEIQDTSAG